MTPIKKRIKGARAEIEAVLRKYDLAGFVSLHGPDLGEVFWNIWPSYSILHGDFPLIQIKSALADYQGDREAQRHDQAQTVQMVDHLAMTIGQAGLQFIELAGVLNAKFCAEHTAEFTPDPSKHNPGVH